MCVCECINKKYCNLWDCLYAVSLFISGRVRYALELSIVLFLNSCLEYRRIQADEAAFMSCSAFHEALQHLVNAVPRHKHLCDSQRVVISFVLREKAAKVNIFCSREFFIDAGK